MKHLLYIVLLCAGCASVPMPVCHYRVEVPFDVYVGNKAWMQEQYRLNGGDGRIVNGFYNPLTRTIYVLHRDNDSATPVLEDLGHELWHLPEMGGMWHP